MARAVAFLVVPSAFQAEFEDFARETLARDSQSSARVLTDSTKQSYQTDVNAEVTKDLINSLATYNPDRSDLLLIQRDTKCSTHRLESWWKSQGLPSANVKILAPQAIKRTLTERWVAAGVHWRTYANRQIANFDGRKLSLDHWIQQFSRLGFAGVGRKLAAQLRVVRPAEIQTQPFALRPADLIGQTQAHCYVKDDDEGGSWVDIQSLLNHIHPKGSVRPVVWNTSAETLDFPGEAVDQLVLYEDGLWSGLETARRLEAMAASPPPAQVVLKFGIVSDFGLLVARHAIRSLGLVNRVQIDTSSSELIRFLRSDLSEDLRNGQTYSPTEYFEALHGHTVARAFEPAHDWTDRERHFCREAGSQLVTQWLRRKAGSEPDEVSIARFALGGGGFASTTLFPRSVPKVCLPLLWLDGRVTVGGNSVDWAPLFVDARRISDTRLLFGIE